MPTHKSEQNMRHSEQLCVLTPCRDNPLIHLNYSIVLYNNGEVRAAGKQFQLFKSKSQSHTPTNTDPEVYTILSSPLSI